MMISRFVGLLVATTILAPSLSGSARAQDSASSPDSATRVAAFLDQLSDSMTILVEQLPVKLRERYPDGDPTTDTTYAVSQLFKFAAAELATEQLEIPGTIKAPTLGALARLDSLRIIWNQVWFRSRARSWWFFTQNGIGGVAAAVGEAVIAKPALIPNAKRFARTLGETRNAVFGPDTIPMIGAALAVPLRDRDDRNGRVRHAEEIRIAALQIEGSVQLAGGDTAGAIAKYLEVIRYPYAPNAPALARTIERLADGKKDRQPDRFIALTVRYLHTMELPAKDSLYQALGQLYKDLYKNGGKTAPDVRPDVGLPPSTKGTDLDGYLDRQFWSHFDYTIPIAKTDLEPALPLRQRLAIAEYQANLIKPVSWLEDRAASLTTQRYPSGRVLILAYHDGMLDPLANLVDSVWLRHQAWYPSATETEDPYGFGREFLGPVIGTQSLYVDKGPRANGPTIVSGRPTPVGPGGTSTWTHQIVDKADVELAKLPEAFVQLSLERKDDIVTAVARVDSVEKKDRRLTARIVLFEDTVRLRGGTVRRMHLNVVRGSASGENYPLGLPISADSGPQVSFSFDLAQIQKNILAGRDSAWAASAESRPKKVARRWSRTKIPPEPMEYQNRFPDPRDWTMSDDHLYVVAFIQDVESGEILQGVVVKVPAKGKKAEGGA